MATTRYHCDECGKTYIGRALPGPMTCNCQPPRQITGTVVLQAGAAAFVPAAAPPAPPPVAVALGYWVEGTDEGAMNREFFYTEAPTMAYRTILPHGHFTCDLYGQIANISYTSRLGAKIHHVLSAQDWAAVQADSAAIYNIMRQHAGF